MTNITTCDGCQRKLKSEENKQAQVWNATTTIDLNMNTSWIQGPIVDLCGNCFAKITKKEKEHD